MGVYDYWVIKIDSLGNILWQNAIGGSGSDSFNNIAKTNDGGFILVGSSNSNISFDKTENCFSGSSDYWVVKINSTGVIQWQNTIGGSVTDIPTSAYVNADNTVMIAGFSSSGISGDKTEGVSGAYDMWILKLNSSGGIIWQNTIGGSGSDLAQSITGALDGGYMVGAYSTSGVSGDKTEPSVGSSDYWVLKLNTSGNIVWQNTIGGTLDDYMLDLVPNPAENKYLLFGYSYSGVGGDKAEGVSAITDYWLVEVNTSGTLVNQETISATLNDFGYSADMTTDGGYVVGGMSSSGIGLDKTQANFGDYDYWLLKLTNCIPATEVCNTLDDDCDGLVDEGVLLTFYADTDADLYGVAGITTTGCTPPPGYAYVAGDCNDTNAAINPGATEICNAIDDDCDALTDEGLLITYYADADGDSYGNAGVTALLCAAAPGYVLNNTDCNDINAAINPGALEICNTLDDDCDALIDEGITVVSNITAAGATTFCQGGNVTLTVSHTGTAVQWKKNGVNIAGATSTNLVVNATGNYTCYAYNACASATSSTITVTVNKNPKAVVTAGGPTSFCAGGSVTLTETPSAGCTYQWYQGVAVIPGATTNVYVATATGNYKCRVTKTATGCFKNSNSVVVSVTCKEGEELSDKDQVMLYPNPAANNIHLATSLQHIDNIYIYNAAGEMVHQINNWQGEAINIARLPAGIYMMHMINAEEEFMEWFVRE